MPGDGLADGPPAKRKAGSSRITGIPCAMVLTGVLRAQVALGAPEWDRQFRLVRVHQAAAYERRNHSSNVMRPRRAAPNGTSERSSTRPPKYRASGSLMTTRWSPTAFR
jgi:hypothetical protein